MLLVNRAFIIYPDAFCLMSDILLFRLFTVFALWLDDENLQKQEIYLPSLPKQYDTHRLAKIMQRQQVRLCWSPEQGKCLSLDGKVEILSD